MTDVRLSDTLDGDLNVDSLGFIVALIDIENAFGIAFEDDHTSPTAYSSVQALVDYVLSAAPAGAGEPV